MLPPKEDGKPASALVRFRNVEEAAWVVENLNGNLAHGLQHPVVVRFANAPGGGGNSWKNDGGRRGDNGWKDQSGKVNDTGGKAKDHASRDAGGKGWRASPYSGGKEGKCKGVGKPFAPDGKEGGKAPPPPSFHELFDCVVQAGVLGGGNVPEDCTVFIKNLPADTTDFDLYKLFSPFGAIPPTGVKAMPNDDGSCKGFGFVDFTEPAAAATAMMALENFELPDGSMINCSMKKPSLAKKASGGGKGR